MQIRALSMKSESDVLIEISTSNEEPYPGLQIKALRIKRNRQN